MSSTNRATKVYNPYAKKKSGQGSRKVPVVIHSSICDTDRGSSCQAVQEASCNCCQPI